MLTQEFLENFKSKTEKTWSTKELDPDVYGFQIQKQSQWLPGLSNSEIAAYETGFNCKFSNDLKLFLKYCNGLDKPSINIYGNDGTPHALMHTFYAYPRDLKLVEDVIGYIEDDDFQEIASEFGLNETDTFFPIYSHRYVLCSDDLSSSKVFSIMGSDAIIYGESIEEYLQNELSEILID